MVEYSSFTNYTLKVPSAERVWQADPKRKVGERDKQKRRRRENKHHSDEEDVVVTLQQEEASSIVNPESETTKKRRCEVTGEGRPKVDIRV